MPARSSPLRLATRGSGLALAQARAVAAMLAPREIFLEIVRTRGDARQDLSLTQLGEGVFVRAIEEELIEERADVAVHSLKDIPSEEAPGLVIAAVPAREDPRDALATRDGRTFGDLAEGAVLATGSPRRIAQLRALRPDLRFTGVRGNVDTRLRKLDERQFDALVVAVAGLKRLGLENRVSTYFNADECVPAVGQGALAIQCREADEETRSLLSSVDEPAAHAAITAERSFLIAIGGGCRVPVGALAEHYGEKLRLRAVIADVDGKDLARSDRAASSADAVGLGRLVAADLRPAMQRLVRQAPVRS